MTHTHTHTVIAVGICATGHPVRAEAAVVDPDGSGALFGSAVDHCDRCDATVTIDHLLVDGERQPWHVPAVNYDPTRRYPYRPVCGCGWQHYWGYVAEHAARDMANAHAEGRL